MLVLTAVPRITVTWPTLGPTRLGVAGLGLGSGGGATGVDDGSKVSAHDVGRDDAKYREAAKRVQVGEKPASRRRLLARLRCLL